MHSFQDRRARSSGIDIFATVFDSRRGRGPDYGAKTPCSDVWMAQPARQFCQHGETFEHILDCSVFTEQNFAHPDEQRCAVSVRSWTRPADRR